MLVDLKRALIALAIVCATLLSIRTASSAEDEKAVDTTKADNTKTNKRDRNENELTAGSQSNNKGDVEITAKIRQMIVKDDSLSTNAHNIKIITVDGIVTLKGPVKSEAEKSTVEKHAIHIVGEKSVKNQIDIAP